jgi:hypothetical protein
LDSDAIAGYPSADITIDRIGDLLNIDIARLLKPKT